MADSGCGIKFISRSCNGL